MKRKAIFLLYRVFETLASPVFLLYLLWRGVPSRAYSLTLVERFGFLPPSWQQTVPGAIWLHAVSVGEALAAASLIEELRIRIPGAPIFLSVGTLAGRAAAEKRAKPTCMFYAPFDFVWAVRRVLRRLKPSVLIVIETEIWPNLFREAERIGCGVAIVNGRISDRALSRYVRFGALFGPVLSLCDRILAQSGEMRRRFIEAGAPEDRVSSAGNLKYDFTPAALPSDSPALRFIEASDAKLWIAASTSADAAIEEEDAVIAAQRALPGWRLIIAPRKPERFETAARKLAASGLRWTRRTALDDPAADVLLLDSVGELSALFTFAGVVFMGGTLAEKGGHNILEPAIFAKPVVAGPHLENFPDIEAAFEAERALVRIRGGGELRDAILRAAADSELGGRARRAAQSQRGAAARAAEAVIEIYDSKYPSSRPPQPAHAFLWLLAQIWKFASARDRRARVRRRRALPAPVVSVGNLTAGGTGKTPTTIELMRAFAAIRPALLTRGHGRSMNEVVIVRDRAESPPIELTGDEAQLYLRSTNAPIAIGADRYQAGRALLAQLDAGVIFLDDGFQHLQLARDFDLALVDALDPFGRGHLLPLGRLREPLAGLARASAFLITHSRQVPRIKAIENTLRRYNPAAPIYRAAIQLRSWADAEGRSYELGYFAGTRAVAFCGLGNPESFWRSLESIGVEPVERHEYGDHHRYSPLEVQRLARHAIAIQADVLLTTAKDSVNLPREFETLIAPLRLYWLEIRMEIEGGEELIERIAEAAHLAKKT